jgi:hypothetical protein
MTEEHKNYLGDSVYVAIEGGMVKLMTDNGYGPSNTIYLEPEVLDALNRYVERMRAIYAEQRQDA